MDNNKLKEIFFNRAEVKDAERVICDNCFEHTVFYLRDSKGREFSLGLITVLECVAFAISQGELPKLPSSWLYDVDHVYGTDLSEREGISFFHNNSNLRNRKKEPNGFHMGTPGRGKAVHPWDNLPKCKCGGYPYMVSRNNKYYQSDEENRIYCRQCGKTTSFGTVTEIRKEWTEINKGDC